MTTPKIITAVFATLLVGVANAFDTPIDPLLADAVGAFLGGLVLTFPTGKK